MIVVGDPSDFEISLSTPIISKVIILPLFGARLYMQRLITVNPF